MRLADRLAERGVTLRHDHIGTQRLPCPECNRGLCDTALAITIEHDGGAVWVCHRCGFKGAVRNRGESVTRPTESPQTKRSQPEHYTTLTPRWRDFWRDCRRITSGTVAAQYLRSRGCGLPPVDGDLRWHSECWHWPTQTRRPAMVGLITDAVTRAPLSLHFTFLRPDGTGKAGTERDKLLLPKHRKAGGVIRLWPDDVVTYSIGLAEGIESALSLAHSHRPVWCTVDAGNLAKLPVLHGIETVLVAVDSDRAGLKATRAFGETWSKAGKDVRLVIPERVGEDLNDVARA